MSRKLVVGAALGLVLGLAGLPTIVAWLEHAGLIGGARWLRAEYATGTAITIIVALLVVLPRERRQPRHEQPSTRQCPVCNSPLPRPGRYCPTCGSRTGP